MRSPLKTGAGPMIALLLTLGGLIFPALAQQRPGLRGLVAPMKHKHMRKLAFG
jgi:hypothetical protein